MDGTDVIDAGLNGAEAVNNLLNDKTVFHLALIILAVGLVRVLFKYFSSSKDADKEVAEMDEQLVKTLAERGFDAEGNRIDGNDDEPALFERREPIERSRVNSRRISSRHYAGEGTYGSRSSRYLDPNAEQENGENDDEE